MNIVLNIKYIISFFIFFFANICFALDVNVESSQKRLFVLNDNRFDFVVEKLSTSKPLEIPAAFNNLDTPENTLVTTLVAMKRGDTAAFKSLNDPNRIIRIESSLKTFNMDFNSVARAWENSFKQNFYISHRIQYRKYVCVAKGEKR
jgi:hypothetical protein